jgi:hypothetical protein
VAAPGASTGATRTRRPGVTVWTPGGGVTSSWLRVPRGRAGPAPGRPRERAAGARSSTESRAAWNRRGTVLTRAGWQAPIMMEGRSEGARRHGPRSLNLNPSDSGPRSLSLSGRGPSVTQVTDLTRRQPARDELGRRLRLSHAAELEPDRDASCPVVLNRTHLRQTQRRVFLKTRRLLRLSVKSGASA